MNKLFSKKSLIEWGIALIIVIGIVVTLIKVFGTGTLWEWMLLPFKYGGDSEPFSITAIDKKVADDSVEVLLLIRNKTDSDYRNFYLLVFRNGHIEPLYVEPLEKGYGPILESHGWKTFLARFDTYPGVGDNYVKEPDLERLKTEDVTKWTFHVESLWSYYSSLDDNYNGKTPWKYILLVVICIIAFILSIKRVPDNSVIMVFIKILAIPLFAVLLILISYYWSNGWKAGSSVSSSSSSAKKKREAAEAYKSAARSRANSARIGFKSGVADAQIAMDRAMADMLSADADPRTPNGQDVIKAANEYKSASKFKNDSLRIGNKGGAADGQAAMDRAMANMLSKK